MKSIATILSVAALAAIATATAKADVSLTFGGTSPIANIGANSLSFNKGTVDLVADNSFSLVTLQSLAWSPTTGSPVGGSFNETETITSGISTIGTLNLAGLLENDPLSSTAKRALFMSGVDQSSTLSDLAGTTADWSAVIGGTEKVSIWLVNEYFSQAPGTSFGGTRNLQAIVQVSAVPELSTIVAGFASLGILVLGVSVHSKRSVFRIG